MIQPENEKLLCYCNTFKSYSVESYLQEAFHYNFFSIHHAKKQILSNIPQKLNNPNLFSYLVPLFHHPNEDNMLTVNAVANRPEIKKRMTSKSK